MFLNNRYLQRSILLLIPFILSYLSLWKVFYDPGVIGHNWDHSVPAFSFYFNEIFKNTFTVWNKQFLGSSNPYIFLHPVIFLQSLLGVFGLNGHWISKLTIFIVLCGSIYSMTWAVRWMLDRNHAFDSIGFLRKRIIATLCGVAYVLSPPVFGNFVGGSVMQFVTLPLLPIIVVFSIKTFSESLNKRNIIILSLLITATVSSTHNFVMSWIFCGLCAVIYFKIKNIFSYFCLIILCLLLNFYGVFAIYYSSHDVSSISQNVNLIESAKSIYHSSPEFFKVICNSGYHNRDFFLNAYPLEGIYYIVAIGLLIIIIRSIIKQTADCSPEKFLRHEKLFIAIFIISIAIAACGSGPLWMILKPLYEKFIPMQLFRSTQRLLTPMNLFFSFVLALALARHRTMSDGKIYFILLVTFLIVLRALPFFSGDFAQKRLLKANLGAVDNYKIAPELGKYLISSYLDEREGRTLFLPASISPVYLPNQYQSLGQGGDPLVLFAPDSAISAFSHENVFPLWRNMIKDFYSLNDSHSVLNIANFFSAKYILFRDDVSHHYVDISLNKYWEKNKKEYSGVLDGLPGLIKKGQGQFASLYELKTFFPIIRPLSGKIFVWQGDPPANLNIFENFDAKNDAVVNSPLFKNKIPVSYLKNNSINSPILEFKKESPTRYIVRVHNLKSDFILLLNENYHPYWRLYLKRIAPVDAQTNNTHKFDEIIKKYKIIDGNLNSQATFGELRKLLSNGFVSTLGDGKEKSRCIYGIDRNGFDHKERKEFYNIDFISKQILKSIQNNNLISSQANSKNAFQISFKKENNDYSLNSFNENMLIQKEEKYKFIQWPEEFHVRTNIFANGWSFNPKIFERLPRADRQNSGYYFINNEGGIEIDLIIEFVPQRNVRIGLLISIITFIVCLFLIFIPQKSRIAL